MDREPRGVFLPEDVQVKLCAGDPEAERRYSLMKLEAFQRVYKELCLDSKVAPEGSQWHRDNQYSYTMYLTNLHNSDIRSDRADNKGVFTARYEPADELVDCDVELRPPISDEMSRIRYAFSTQLLTKGHLSFHSTATATSSVGYSYSMSMNPGLQRREEMVRISKAALFMADLPSPAIRRQDMSGWHQKAIELATSEKQQVLYLRQSWNG